MACHRTLAPIHGATLATVARRLAAGSCLLALVGCGGGGGGSAGVTGSVAGLLGSGLVLEVNGQQVAVAAGSAGFEGLASADGSLKIAVRTQPVSPVQLCAVQSTPPGVDCATPTELLLAAGTSPRGLQLLAVHPTSGALAALAGGSTALPDDTTPSALAVSVDGRTGYVLLQRGIAVPGSVQMVQIDTARGTLTPPGAGTLPVGRQPAGVALHPSGRWLYVSAQDGLHVVAVDGSAGRLTPLAGSPFPIPADAGRPAITPDGRFAYLNDSVGRSIHALALDAGTGAPTPLTTSPLAAGIQPSPLAVHPSGRYAYSAETSLGGRGTVGAWAIDAATGALTALAGSPITLPAANASLGESPAQMLLNPAGDTLWAWGWQAMRTARIDPLTGALSATPGTAPPTLVLSAVGVLAVARSGRFLFDAMPCCVFGTGIATLAIDGSTGALASVAGSPFATGSTGQVLAAVPVVR